MADRRFYKFGRFRLDPSGRVLYRGDQVIPLPPKAADTLLLLLQNAGDVVEKEDLLKQVWQDAFVEEGSLTRTIFILRKALKEGRNGQQYIATVSKRGYRFVAKVTQASSQPRLSGPRKLMLLVLPFENLSEDLKQDYFADGLTEEMITQLSRLNPERLGVIARTSAMQYKGINKSILRIGRELGVAYILEGSVRRSGNRVRIAAQLIQVSDQSHLWAESYERDLGDILSLQADVARAVAKEIRVKFAPQEQQRLAVARHVNPEAYEAYLKGRHFWYKRTEEAMRKGIEYFNLAIQHDPTYGAAHDGISDCYVMLACRGVMPAKEAFDLAQASASKALEIDSGLGEAYASLAHVRLHDWDWKGLDEDFKRAIELNPGYAIAYYWYAEYLMATGKPEESITRVKQAQQMDPVSSVLNASLAMILYLARRYAEAREQLCTALDVDPNHFLLHFRLGLVCQQERGYAEAVEEMRAAVTLSGRSTETLTGLAQAYAAASMRSEMQQVLDELRQQAGQRYVSPYNMARVYAFLKDREQTFTWLQKAYEERNPDLIELSSEPVFDSVRPDPRFADLLQCVGRSS